MLLQLDRDHYDQLVQIIENCITSLTKLKKTITKSHKPVQKHINQIYSDEKALPLHYGENKIKVGYYSASIKGDKRVITLTPDTYLDWSSKPIQWLSQQINSSHYKIDMNQQDSLVIEIPIDEKFGKLLGQVSWAFHAMNNPLEENT